MLKKSLAALVLIILTCLAAWQLSPWPSALFYRYLFDKGGVAMNEALAKHVPVNISSRIDIAYGEAAIEKLDIHLPAGVAGTERRLPLIVWTHGGGFLSGSKEQLANYLRIMAEGGYTVAGIDYTLAPAARHPTPTRQANAALAFLLGRAEEFNIDPERIFLAGDSAGSHISAQLGLAITDPAYAGALGITASIKPAALRGIILHCGIYDPALLNAEGAMAGFLRTVSWSYLGTRDVNGPDVPPQFSIIANMNASMPPLFITAGNADPLLPHSVALAGKAVSLGVQVDSLFFPDDYVPPLQHEYEFNLDVEAGQLALQRSLKFVAEHAK